MEWVTRERPKIDRIACPWLILRFIDTQAQFHYVPSDQVLAIASARAAIPFWPAPSFIDTLLER